MNPADLYADDPTIHQGNDGSWYHVPHRRGLKLLFLVFSLSMLLPGCVLIYPPLARWIGGETANARVVEILREEPGRDPERIRYKVIYFAGENHAYGLWHHRKHISSGT